MSGPRPRDKVSPPRPCCDRNERVMMTGARRCPTCDEPIREGLQEHRCAEGSEQTIQVGAFAAPGTGDDSIGETVAYTGDIDLIELEDGRSYPEELDDGFPEVDDLVDSTLGQYRLESVVGRGSMGRVYRGEHLGLGRPCAVK